MLNLTSNDPRIIIKPPPNPAKDAMDDVIQKNLFLDAYARLDNKQKVEDMIYQEMSASLRDAQLHVKRDAINSNMSKEQLFKELLKGYGYENLLAKMMVEMGRQPTTNAVNRTLEFINATTQSFLAQTHLPDENDMGIANVTTERDRRLQFKKELDLLMHEISELMFVSKARVIMEDFPESVSISVQMTPSIEDDEAMAAMQAFEDILTTFKPINLIELEVSITNKVVY